MRRPLAAASLVPYNGAVNREPAVKLIAGSSPIRDLPVFETVDLASRAAQLSKRWPAIAFPLT